jgi:RecA-family ATPase
LIVVDTLSRAMAGGNENSPEDMDALVGHIDLIRQALPSHVSVIHHSGKDAARGARGHSSLRAAADTEIEITREIGTKTSTARVTKQRELELGDEFPFCLVPVELGTNRRGKAVTSCVVRANDPTAKKDRNLEREMEKDRLKKKLQDDMAKEVDDAVIRVINEERNTGLPGDSRTTIRNKAMCSRERVDDAIERLLEAGAIIRAELKTGGNNAKTEVKDGFTIAPDGD